MHVLIIGGTGLISTAITQQLVEHGDEVTLYNRGQREADIPQVAQLHGDRTDYAAFETQMQEAGTFDCVIDMVAFKEQDVESAIRAFRGRIGQYIFCSTVDVYTKPAARYPIREDAERKPAPSFPYAFHKAACERLLEQAHAYGELNVTMIRPAWTYGESGSVLHTFGWSTYFLDRLRQGQPVIVPGDGTSFWVACHREDVARAFVCAVGNAAAFGQGYHVTGEEWLTWNAYHRTVAQALDAPPPKLVHIPTDLLGRVAPKAAEWCVENFHYNNLFDNAAARKDLGFEYTIPFAEGVKRVIAWLDERDRIESYHDHSAYDRIVSAWQQLGEGMVDELSGVELENPSPKPGSQPITFHPIGHVEQDAGDEGLSIEELRTRPARIVLDPALIDGMLGLEPGSDIVVVFCFHQSTGYELQLHPRGDPSRPIRGVFATRSSYRPNPIAMTSVRIERLSGNVLEVVGLDALDGSPVLDIKPHTSCFDSPYT